MNRSNRIVLEFKTLSGCACMSKRAYKGSSGYDLYAVETKTIKTQGREVIALDLAMAILEGYYGQSVPMLMSDANNQFVKRHQNL